MGRGAPGDSPEAPPSARSPRLDLGRSGAHTSAGSPTGHLLDLPFGLPLARSLGGSPGSLRRSAEQLLGPERCSAAGADPSCPRVSSYAAVFETGTRAGGQAGGRTSRRTVTAGRENGE